MKTRLTSRYRKVIWRIVSILGVLISGCGMFGVWLQGQFWTVFINATFSEVRDALTWPVMFTFTGGTMIVSSLLVGPFTERLSQGCRLALCAGYCVISLIAFSWLGTLAAKAIEPLLR